MDWILTKEEANEIRILLEDNNTCNLGFNLLRLKIIPIVKNLSFKRTSTGLYTTGTVQIYIGEKPKLNITLYYYSDERPVMFHISIKTDKIYYDWDLDLGNELLNK